MKFADPTRSIRPDSVLVLVGALSLAVFSTSCSSTSPREYMEEAPQSEIGTREASYAVATTPEDLKRLIAEDLESQNTAAVYAGLEAFIGENVSRGTAKRADLIWGSIKPTTMLQYGKGRSVMSGVKQLGDLLSAEGAKEMETAFESLRQGDFEEVQRLRDQPMGIFHPDTAALSRDVRPYALLADGVLSYRDVAASSDPTGAEVQMALDKLSAAQSELAKIGETKGMFLADAAAAQALERAGQIDAAAEYWMRIADSEEFLTQPDVMRNLVAARIKTYGVRMKERLIVEVEAERRAELRARDAQYSAQVDQLEEKHQSFDSWARQGFASSARRMAELAQEDEQQKVRLASMASTAEDRDAQLGRAQDALAVRLGALDDRAGGLEGRTAGLEGRTDGLEGRTEGLEGRADGLEGRTDDLAERTAELGDQGEAMTERVDREVALLRGNLEEAVSSLRTDQAGLTARADSLERRASELSNSAVTNATDIEAVKKEAKELRAEALELRGQAADLASETSSLRAGVEGSNRASQQLAADIALRDADLAQSLRDLANYQAAVEELTANAALDAMAPTLDDIEVSQPAEGGSETAEPAGDTAPVPTTGKPSDRGSFMALPAYLAVHSMQDVFGVDGEMQQLTAFIMPE